MQEPIENSARENVSFNYEYAFVTLNIMILIDINQNVKNIFQETVITPSNICEFHLCE